MKHGGKSGTNSKRKAVNLDPEAEFNFGYFYRTIEEQFDTFSGQAGNPYSLTDIALRVGALLEAKAVRAELGNSQLVSEVWRAAAQRSATAEAEDVDVATRPDGSLKRRLSKRARMNIAKAQRKRWRLKRREQATVAKPKSRKAAAVTCRMCNVKFPNRSKYMHHVQSHSEWKTRQIAALRAAKAA